MGALCKVQNFALSQINHVALILIVWTNITDIKFYEIAMKTYPLSALEHLEQCLTAVDTWNPFVNAMMIVDAESARQAAQAADYAAKQGRSLGLLHGIPIAVKDNLDTLGLRTTYGSGFFKDHIPAKDATVVSRLRQAGAVIVGKSSLHEFAFGVRSNNPVSGQCRNPWDITCIPGGSSGGSGVAVEA